MTARPGDDTGRPGAGPGFGPGYFGGLPLLARLLVWALIVGYTVRQAPPQPWHRLGTALVMVLAALAMLATASRSRRHRGIAVCVASAAGLAGMLLSHNGVAEIPVYLAAFRAPHAFEGRVLWTFTWIDCVATGTALVLVSGTYPLLLCAFGVPLLVQRVVVQHDLVAEHDRAQALLAELQAKRDTELQAAALTERARIAREMHDVLAHSLAGLSLQVQAARAVAAGTRADPAVLDALDTAAGLARDGLAEARSAVGALRGPDGLGLDALPALVERHPGAVELALTGRPRDVPPELGHAVYRAVQESLTNAARYAPGSPVRVAADWSPDELVVGVDDDGPAPGRGAVAGSGSGLGLAGMQERLRQFGASVQAGPRPGGGWRVEVRVPLERR